MKTKITLITALFFVNLCFGQSVVGIKGGINLTDIGGDARNSPMGIRTGIHLGIVVNTPLSEMVKFQPELLYTQQGARASAYGYSETLVYNYLAIPTVFKFFISNELAFLAGSQVGMALTSKIKNNLGQSITLTGQTNSLDAGIIFGMGGEINEKFLLEARYFYGMTSTINDQTRGHFPNRVFQFSCGYLITQ